MHALSKLSVMCESTHKKVIVIFRVRVRVSVRVRFSYRFSVAVTLTSGLALWFELG